MIPYRKALFCIMRGENFLISKQQFNTRYIYPAFSELFDQVISDFEKDISMKDGLFRIKIEVECLE